MCVTKSFQADRDPRKRGPRPLNSNLWRGASRPSWSLLLAAVFAAIGLARLFSDFLTDIVRT